MGNLVSIDLLVAHQHEHGEFSLALEEELAVVFQ